jgi:hypothetical protein
MLNLVTVVGRNTHILPHMLKHYEGKVDKMYVAVYRQDENDGVLEEVLDLGIKPCIVATEEKYNWERVTALYNYIKRTKPNDWWIVSDDDELQVYPYEISDIIKECEKHNFDFVTGGFLDRIGPEGIFPEVTRDTDIHSAFPYAGFFRYPMSKACPNKVTLMKGFQDVCSGQHYATFKDGTNSWGKEHPKRMPIEEVFTQVHHFKWDSTCVERIKEVADINKPYAYSEEYKTMYDAIRVFDWKIDICNPEFKVEKLNNFSYIDYMDYTKWNLLRDKIVTI